ncbi:PTS glucose transporter subunit IIA [Arcanobacterium canis]|uniref:Glucose PTS transporter subunit IIA n=1 Tax=Arcanobacterium canis TaxID=999183 RepID=A0ABY8FZQ4_9ACTO|nr:glucose PTS transporter subunit IIA [Arcanobacterium canis]WFM84007.1 glucose PTS transporter subunit IIA [Arcanobacterium canis]
MFGFGKKKEEFHAPFAGTVLALDDVPDEAFSSRMLGDGFAVSPDPSASVVEVIAPIDGTVVKIFKTHHAFSMRTPRGVDVLVHIGMDTVELGGKGMEALVESGAEVVAGTPIIRVDAQSVRDAGKSLVTPIVFTKKTQVDSVKVNVGPIDPSEVAATVTLV